MTGFDLLHAGHWPIGGSCRILSRVDRNIDNIVNYIC